MIRIGDQSINAEHVENVRVYVRDDNKKMVVFTLNSGRKYNFSTKTGQTCGKSK